MAKVPSIITPGEAKTIVLCDAGQNFNTGFQLHEWSSIEDPEVTYNNNFERPSDSGVEVRAGDGLPNQGDITIITYLELTTPLQFFAIVRVYLSTVKKIIRLDLNGTPLQKNVSALLSVRPEVISNTIYKCTIKYRTSSLDWF